MTVQVQVNVRPLIQARIAAQIPAFKEVAGASSLTAILQGRLSESGCYIFREKNAPEANELVNAISQRVIVSIGLVIVVRNVKDAHGNDADDISFNLQNSLKTALLGWQPEAGSDPMQFGGGGLVSFANGYHIWKDTFITQQFIRAT
jgi:hypothetical protein